jgi:hypothetical protein
MLLINMELLGLIACVDWPKSPPSSHVKQIRLRRGLGKRNSYSQRMSARSTGIRVQSARPERLFNDINIVRLERSCEEGQEWKSVFVLNVVDGCMPSDLGAGTSAEIEEERRLLYVAMTRARDNLHLSCRNAFSRTGSMPRVTATSTRHGRVLFPIDCSRCLNVRFGLSQWPEPEVTLRAKVRVSMLERACAECGAKDRRLWCR